PRSFVPQSEKKLEERNMNGGGSGSGGGGSGAVKTPTDFLKSIRGRPVVVKLNSGVDYRGRPSSPTLGFLCILACLDAYMNIAMEQTEEYVNGQLKKNVR
ncbi:U6 snRNA-associated Sm-like protein, partial [Musa troglodytarum]